MTTAEIDIDDIEGWIRKETGYWHKVIILDLKDGNKLKWRRKADIHSDMQLVQTTQREGEGGGLSDG